MKTSQMRTVAWVVRGALALLALLLLGLLAAARWQESGPLWQMLVDTAIGLVPIGSLYLGLTLLAEVVLEETSAGAMQPAVRKLLFWTPRVIVMVFAVFISVFSLDVFGQGYSIGETLIALAMHLIPTALILLALVVAWRWEWIGGLAFLALGMLYIAFAREMWMWSLLIAGPLVVIGLLFLANWRYRSELHLVR